MPVRPPALLPDKSPVKEDDDIPVGKPCTDMPGGGEAVEMSAGWDSKTKVQGGTLKTECDVDGSDKSGRPAAGDPPFDIFLENPDPTQVHGGQWSK